MASNLAEHDYDSEVSDELDFGPPPPNPYATAGARSVAAIIENAGELRIESKKVIKNLQGGHGAPGTRENRALPNAVPTGKDLARFLVSIVPNIHSSFGSVECPALPISYATIRNAMKLTVYTIQCRHDTFRLTCGEQDQIKTLFRKLQEDGQISKERKLERQWLPARTIGHFVRALLKNAIRHGTYNWSLVIYKCLCIILQSALSCRAGDIARSVRYEDDECLRYEHVELKVYIAEDSEAPIHAPVLDRVVLKARITLKFTKGYKREPSLNHSVTLESLSNVEYNCFDPLKLLLAHALRHGLIKDAITPEEAVQNALARRDHTIQWNFPTRPVLCSLINNKLDLTSPAPASQLISSLNEASILSGVDRRVRSHDSRRGAASDATLVRPQRNMPSAAEALNHSHYTVQHGITAQYVGCNTTSPFGERLAIPADPFAIQHIDTSTTTSVIARKRKRLQPKEVDDALNLPENSKIKKLKWARSAMIRKLKKERSAALARSVLDEQHARTNPAIEVDSNVLNTALPAREVRDSEDSEDESTQGAEMMPATSDNEDEYANVDPALLRSQARISTIDESMQTPAEAAAIEQDAQRMAEETYASDRMLADDLDLGLTEVTAMTQELRVLDAPVSEFLPWLCRINTNTDIRRRRIGPNHHLRGGSRDDPTPFTFCCKYDVEGSRGKMYS
ncbi:hypothetical protein LTR50_007403 [Elasticomyces elasticus]|nr:hypothetical protein LTR50_007403 [Elasticomyces elasticus]